MQLGTLIAGRYRLDDRLAAGGMGEVWRGTDTRLNRVVAVKVLHSGLAGNDRFRARFHQEAQAVAALQSPGIVALYDYGEEAGPEGVISYLIMELVRGTSLDKLIRQRGRLAPTEVMKIVGTAAEALDVAHRAGIIHRDIKPGNLLIADDGTAKIVDFGIASARGQAGLTETGTVMGTVSYAAPEQLQGAQLTGATDLYSLGVVAYECLAGALPFPGTEPTAVITAHLTGQPPPLPQDVPPGVSQIVMRLLSKDPRLRFASASELAAACRDGRPGQAASPPTESTRVMAQGAVPAGAPGIGRDEPPQNDWPAPREPEEAKRSPAVPITLTVLGVLVLVVAFIIWSPWNDGGPDDPAQADSTTGPAEEATSEEATEEPDDEETEDEPEDDSTDDEADEEPTEDEGGETTSQPVDPGIVTLDDYIGQDVTEAEATLTDEGFTNVTTEATSDDAELGQCEVTAQNPEPGSEVGYDTPITLEYAANHPDCLT
ncbi:serine/threonine protein kinase [Glycomyces xiaoerkulensis]|uniref:serine/threonine protein kinase n=1 Tax=Glycomyces xiaoerkulensis TaxID=2038139 RepID=UPI000C2595D3|nr:serine/threonine protein kinase [Glycomyces xiaoerkulensis]